jgi:hypothetical protein
MDPDGQISLTGAMTGDKQPNPAELIAALEQSFRDGARSGAYRATVLVVDMVVIPPGKTAKQDGIALRFDHRLGYSVIIGIPYSFSDKGELVLEEPFATEGEHRVFPGPPKTGLPDN